jgi:hypothetical protein
VVENARDMSGVDVRIGRVMDGINSRRSIGTAIVLCVDVRSINAMEKMRLWFS